MAHKGQTIRLLKDIIPRINEENIDLTILSVLVLESNGLRPKSLVADEILLFDPHLPSAGLLPIYGRKEEAVQPHGRTM